MENGFRIAIEPQRLTVGDIEVLRLRMPQGQALITRDESARDRLKSMLTPSVKANQWKIQPKRWKNPTPGEDWYGIMLWRKLN